MSPGRRAFVTGGTGFIGSAIVRALLEDGTAVRALVRPGASRENLADLTIETREGDLSDPDALARDVDGCQEVYHCAALYAFWAKDSREFYRANVEGTANILRAAARAGADRIVYTSSVATVTTRFGEAGDESGSVKVEDAPGHYKRSKILAEAEALRLHREEGVPVIVTNPSAPVGPRDVKPTPTGRMIVDFLHGRMPAYVDTGLNVVDVDDVGRGHVLAARRGRPGERYILGGEDMELIDIFRALEELTGIPAPRVRLPHGAALLAALACEAVSRVTGREPAVTLESTKLARKHMYFDASKAARDLGFASGSAVGALEKAVRWFETSGRVRRTLPRRAGGATA